MLTKYVVGAKANPPKNPSNPLKKGKVIPRNIVSAAQYMKKSLLIDLEIKFWIMGCISKASPVITNINGAGNQTKRKARSEFKLLH